MKARFDLSAADRAAAGGVLRLPRGPHRGKLGEVRASSVGSSLELHDFRQYQPGDDLRQIDWNAVARTGELYLRVRQHEVSPRVEVLVDASASMDISRQKAARVREVAAWVCALALRGGLEPIVIAAGGAAQSARGPATRALLEALQFDGREPFDAAMRRCPPLLHCGLRVVVSDFLYESSPATFVTRLARGASGLALLQLIDPEDIEPSGGSGARLTDSESGEVLERILTPDVLGRYRARFDAHVSLWQAAAHQVRAAWAQSSAEFSIDILARRELRQMAEFS